MNKEFEYYKDKEFLSNSMLSWLKVGAAYFKKMYDEYPKDEEEEEDSYMNFGNAFHTFVLEPNEFNKRYTILTVPSPSNVVQKKFIDKLADNKPLFNEDYKTEDIIEIYKSIYSVGNKSPKFVEEAATKLYSEYKPYIDYLSSVDDRKVLSKYDKDRISNMYGAIRKNWKAAELLLDEFRLNGYESFNERIIFFEFEGIKMKCKVDRILYNRKTKHIILVDLKTNSLKNTKSSCISQIESAIKDEYDYDRQLALYKHAMFQEFGKDNILDFDVFVVAVQTNIVHEARVIKLSFGTLKQGFKKAIDLIMKYKIGMEYDFDHDSFYFERNSYIEI
jgi:hypothetical protein